jgi:hypothetical protein
VMKGFSWGCSEFLWLYGSVVGLQRPSSEGNLT